MQHGNLCCHLYKESGLSWCDGSGCFWRTWTLVTNVWRTPSQTSSSSRSPGGAADQNPEDHSSRLGCRTSGTSGIVSRDGGRSRAPDRGACALSPGRTEVTTWERRDRRPRRDLGRTQNPSHVGPADVWKKRCSFLLAWLQLCL